MIRTLRERWLSPVKTAYLGAFHARRHPIRLDPPVASFTFDDVPMSAFETGVPILEEAGARGTFYVSLGIEPKAPRDFLRAPEVIELDRRGHDIGCHTWSHYSLAHGSVSGLLADAGRNTRELQTLLRRKIEHFAYPHGEVSLRAKRAMSGSYATLRGIRRGINAGTADLNLLRVMPIYTDGFSEKAILDALRRAATLKGWVVFYTHGVTRRPDPYDSTPEQLRRAVTLVRDGGFRILTVSQVARAFPGASTATVGANLETAADLTISPTPAGTTPGAGAHHDGGVTCRGC